MNNNIIVIYSSKDESKINNLFRFTKLDELSLKKINTDVINFEDVKDKIQHSYIINITSDLPDFVEIDLDDIISYTVDNKTHLYFDINKIDNNNKDVYLNKLKEIYDTYKEKDIEYNNNIKTRCNSIKIPDKYYTDNYILIDIQMNYKNSEVIYIFRDKDSNKIYHKENSRNGYYYMDPSLSRGEAPLINYVQNLILKKDRNVPDDAALYEQDVQSDLRHSIDYYYNREDVPELDYKLRILFWDIEVYSAGDKSFPVPSLAAKQINSISFKVNYEDVVYVYLLKLEDMQKTEIKKLDNVEVVIFDDEKDLINSFIQKVHKLGPDLCCGWNTDDFDVPYVINRMKKLNMCVEDLSPLNKIQYDKRFPDKYPLIFGLIFLDQLTLYKELTYSEEENYRLSTIAQKVLGKDKISYDGGIDDMYTSDINRFIEYSAVDTILLHELELSLNFITTKFGLIKVCASTWKKSETTTGLVDPIILKFAKNLGILCKNKKYVSPSQEDEFIGAKVLDPVVGLHKWVVDFDFKSLYPSIICTMNIGPNTYIGKIDTEIAKKYLYKRDYLPNTISIMKYPLLESSIYTEISKEEFLKFIDSNNYIVAINGCIFKNHNEEISFFNEILTYLSTSRDYNKKIMLEYEEKSQSETDPELSIKYEEKSKQHDCSQLAYKIIMNSIYGLISNKFFRMYNLNMAECVTSTGQEVLKYTSLNLYKYMERGDTEHKWDYIKLMDNFSISDLKYIIYGDTDSIFVSMGEYIKKKEFNNE